MLYTNQYICQNILAIKALRPFVFVFGFNAFSAILMIRCHFKTRIDSDPFQVVRLGATRNFNMEFIS